MAGDQALDFQITSEIIYVGTAQMGFLNDTNTWSAVFSLWPFQAAFSA